MKKTKIIAVVMYSAVVVAIMGFLCYQCYTLTNSNIELNNAYEELEVLYEEEKTKALKHYENYTSTLHDYQTTLEEYEELKEACNAVYGAHKYLLYSHLSDDQKPEAIWYSEFSQKHGNGNESWRVLKMIGEAIMSED